MRLLLSISVAAATQAQLANVTPNLRLNLIPACMLRDEVELPTVDQRIFRTECSTLQREVAALGSRLRAQQGRRPPGPRDITEANRQRDSAIQRSCERLDRGLTEQGRRILLQFFTEIENSTTTIRLSGNGSAQVSASEAKK